MIKGLVTVVLPIYNVEKYLDRCIESVVGQTYRNIEVLLIDDGSTDSCPKICDSWCEKDNRVKVIHKENQGLGMARNTGIEAANGEYICFFDSDDFVDLTTVEKLYGNAVANESDIVSFGLNFADENGNVLQTFVPPVGYSVYTDKDISDFFIPEITAPDPRGNGQRNFYMSSCTLFYSMKLIEKSDWRFVSERDIISEDVYSLLGLFKDVRKVSVVPEALYYYCRNTSSLSRSYKPERFEKTRSFYLKTVELCKRMGYGDEILHRVSKPYLAFTIASLKQETVSPYPFYKKMKKIKSFILDDVLQSVLEQNKNDNVGFNRKILYFAMRNKLYFLSYLLLRGKANK